MSESTLDVWLRELTCELRNLASDLNDEDARAIFSKPSLRERIVNVFKAGIFGDEEKTATKTSSCVVIFDCEQCSKQFKSKRLLLKHNCKSERQSDTIEDDDQKTQTSEEEVWFSCDDCSFRTRSLKYISKHHSIKHRSPQTGGALFECSQCDFFAEKRALLRKHRLSVHSADGNTCKACGKSYRTEKLLKVHMKIRCQENRTFFSCRSCYVKTTSQLRLRVHEIAKHGSEWTPEERNNLELTSELEKLATQCHQCGELVYKSAIATHSCTLKEKPQHQCPHCSKTFSFLHRLKIHIMNHTEERPYVCETCGKRFRTSSALKEHATRHAENKRLPCNVCGKSFKSKSGLTRHMFRHAGVLPYQCIECNRAFVTNSERRAHQKSHTKCITNKINS